MRVLYVTNGFPFPLTSGYLRHYFLIRELAQRHKISLVSLVGARYRSDHAAAMAPFTEEVIAVPVRAGRRSSTLRRTWQGRQAARKVAEAAGRLAAQRQFDVMLLSGRETTPVLEQVRGVPLVVDLCDATSLRISGSMRYASPRRLPLLWLKHAQVRRVERQLVARTRHLLVASVRDRVALLGPGSEREAAIVPNGVDLEYWQRTAPTLGASEVVFTGAMDYPPNADAARHLVEQVMPGVRREIPDARLAIVGRDPLPALVTAASGLDWVSISGYVDDMRPHLERAAVFAAPVRFGAGIQNKVLEALALELPVVASSLAADGLRTAEGDRPPLTVADTPDEMANAIVRELRSVRADPSPRLEGRDYVGSHFVWKRSAETVERVLLEAIGAAA